MQQTEKYVILIGNDNKEIDISGVRQIWAKLAAEEFQKSNVFVCAIIDIPVLVCNSVMGCSGYYEDCIRISCTRMPNVCSSSQDYLTSLRNVFMNLKKNYKAPYIVIESCNVNCSYFPPSE